MTQTPTTPATQTPALRGMVRVALFATSASLAMGMVLSLLVAGPAAAVANALVWVGLALLVSIPVLTVVGVLIDEWRRRDWRFVLAGVAALCLLAFAIARKLPIWG